MSALEPNVEIDEPKPAKVTTKIPVTAGRFRINLILTHRVGMPIATEAEATALADAIVAELTKERP